ncbi:MAG: hypothetical protein ACXW4L_04380, partial [Candidatus Limnocylindrales bacterium]
GLHGIGSTSVVADNDATRGMVRQVRFLVTVEEIAEDKGAKRSRNPETGRPVDRGDAPASHRAEGEKEKA